MIRKELTFYYVANCSNCGRPYTDFDINERLGIDEREFLDMLKLSGWQKNKEQLLCFSCKEIQK